MKSNLTKKDFLRYLTCPTAAYYGWQKYTSRFDGDEFLAHLAAEGHTAGRLARRLFAGAELISEINPLEAAKFTTKALSQGNCTLFEACIIEGDFLIRPDVLIKRGKKLYLLEAKSKTGDIATHRDGRMLVTIYGGIRSEWRDYVHDLAFQCEVMQRAFPDSEIIPYLLLPEAKSPALSNEIQAARNESLTYDIPTEEHVKSRRKESLFQFFPAIKAIDLVRSEVAEKMNAMVELWRSGERPISPLRYACRNCEFRLRDGNDPSDGWHKCWGKLADPKPHLYDLNQLYSLKVDGQQLLADQKIQEGKTSLMDVTEDELHGDHSARQSIQLRHTKTNSELISPALGEAIRNLQWPVAFLDFETFASAIPWYEGMRPHELMPFQYSAHILNEDGGMQHEEWLNIQDCNPTIHFIRALRSALGNTGSVLIYTDYEIRVLRDAQAYLRRIVPSAQEERAWIEDLLRSGRLIDQHDWVHRWYFHPWMAGRTSIKKVLPAVWRSNTSLHNHPYFSRYFREKDGVILDPYKTLPSAVINGQDFEIREGCGAMRGYRELILGAGSKCEETKDNLAQMLSAYVTLDTASQWMIFVHWRERLGC